MCTCECKCVKYTHGCLRHLQHFHFQGVHLSGDNKERCAGVSPEEWVTVWGSVAIRLFTLMERSEWNMADVVIAALQQRKERFLTLMLPVVSGRDSGTLKTNSRPGRLDGGKRRGRGQKGRKDRTAPQHPFSQLNHLPSCFLIKSLLQQSLNVCLAIFHWHKPRTLKITQEKWSGLAFWKTSNKTHKKTKTYLGLSIGEGKYAAATIIWSVWTETTGNRSRCLITNVLQVLNAGKQ